MKSLIFFCDIDNFGDSLNKEIFKNLNIEYKNIKKADFIGIGSLLDNLLLDAKGYAKNPIPIKIFSSGFGFDDGEFFHNKDIIIPEKLKRDIRVYALRGYKT